MFVICRQHLQTSAEEEVDQTSKVCKKKTVYLCLVVWLVKYVCRVVPLKVFVSLQILPPELMAFFSQLNHWTKHGMSWTRIQPAYKHG
ncbi:hypothetical protein QVD17_06466 [Tagetes erecta]|uniref:Uncharacterized protein n=1 Tax=Tagetes erecta TaxID=13708 RepID=A0AAD8LLR8_TARER|nr:hypothetical protein QVD17_06466 [Tagetes erecta]